MVAWIVWCTNDSQFCHAFAVEWEIEIEMYNIVLCTLFPKSRLVTFPGMKCGIF